MPTRRIEATYVVHFLYLTLNQETGAHRARWVGNEYFAAHDILVVSKEESIHLRVDTGPFFEGRIALDGLPSIVGQHPSETYIIVVALARVKVVSSRDYPTFVDDNAPNVSSGA